jgi:hypothetical protein
VVGHQRISADGRAGLSAYGGVEQYLGGGFGRRGGMRIAIHPGRQPGAVVQELQLPPNAGGSAAPASRASSVSRLRISAR